MTKALNYRSAALQKASTTDALVTAKLEPGESLIWSARPYDRIVFRPRDWILVPLSVLVTSVALAATIILLTVYLNAPFAALSMVVSIGSLLLAVGRFVFDARRRRLTLYALTDQRILVCSANPDAGSDAGSDFGVRSVPLSNIGDVQVVSGIRGMDSVKFNLLTPPNQMAQQHDDWPNPWWRERARSKIEHLEFIDDAEAVAADVRQAKRAYPQVVSMGLPPSL